MWPMRPTVWKERVRQRQTASISLPNLPDFHMSLAHPRAFASAFPAKSGSAFRSGWTSDVAEALQPSASSTNSPVGFPRVISVCVCVPLVGHEAVLSWIPCGHATCDLLPPGSVERVVAQWPPSLLKWQLLQPGKRGTLLPSTRKYWNHSSPSSDLRRILSGHITRCPKRVACLAWLYCERRDILLPAFSAAEWVPAAIAAPAEEPAPSCPCDHLSLIPPTQPLDSLEQLEACPTCPSPKFRFCITVPSCQKLLQQLHLLPGPLEPPMSTTGLYRLHQPDCTAETHPALRAAVP